MAEVISGRVWLAVARHQVRQKIGRRSVHNGLRSGCSGIQSTGSSLLLAHAYPTVADVLLAHPDEVASSLSCRWLVLKLDEPESRSGALPRIARSGILPCVPAVLAEFRALDTNGGIVGENAILNGKGYQDAKHGKRIAGHARFAGVSFHKQLDAVPVKTSDWQRPKLLRNSSIK